ncbi:type II toxin-antitoxin system VapC family toxin [Candidatus Marithioploca araucensis]|uniref:Type II toxin-antitoxin system VapC family toxin n=1 Tax=Candidatus Marithioploca araucensis TaxID=70273 RepID=A0ABT7VQP5_9GAMM|nr:type II toxin-antitoxin system VapC family toxin [Candidatus Marithioploca araucensis]
MKKIFVVDSSVAIKWYFPEIHKEAAERLLKPNYHLHVPHLFLLEFINVVCKKRRRGEINAQESDFVINEIQQIPLEWHNDRSVLTKAYEIANNTQRSLYDCLYINLAISLDCEMVTADLKFYEALKSGDYAKWLRWIENL